MQAHLRFQQLARRATPLIHSRKERHTTVQAGSTPAPNPLRTSPAYTNKRRSKFSLLQFSSNPRLNNPQADLGFLVADDADVAESIVEQAVGALLPFSQATPASSSLAPAKGSAAGGGSKRPAGTSSAEGAQAGRMDSTATTTMGVTPTAGPRAVGGAFPRLGRTSRGISGPAHSGGREAPSRRFSRDLTGSGAAAEGLAIEKNSPSSNDNHRGQGAARDGETNTPSFVALDPPSPSSPRRRNNLDDVMTQGGLFRGSTADGRSTKREQGRGIGPDSDGGLGGRVAGSRTVASAGNGGTGDVGISGGEEAGGYVVLLTPTLEQVSLLVAALEAPQVPKMGFVVVCPLYDWNQERDEEEIRRLREFTQVWCRTARLTKRNTILRQTLVIVGAVGFL